MLFENEEPEDLRGQQAQRSFAQVNTAYLFRQSELVDAALRRLVPKLEERLPDDEQDPKHKILNSFINELELIVFKIKIFMGNLYCIAVDIS